MVNVVIISVVVVAVLSFFYHYGKKSHWSLMEKIQGKKIDVSSCETKKVQNILFVDIVAYFKSLSLKKDRDIPFVANLNDEKTKTMFEKHPEASCVLLVGTYNEESDELENMQILVSDTMDDKCSEILKNDAFVVLS